MKETRRERAERVMAAVRLYGSAAGAARALNLSKRTVSRILKGVGESAVTVGDRVVRGRNAGMVRVLPTGGVVNVGKPVPEQISVADLARGLSRIGWECGQTPSYVSLAAVSAGFSQWVASKEKDVDLSFLALLRFASAAYVGYVPDFIRKRMTGNWPRFEEEMTVAIHDAFDLLFRYEVEKDRMDCLFDEYAATDPKFHGSSPRMDEPEFIRHFTALSSVKKLVSPQEEPNVE